MRDPSELLDALKRSASPELRRLLKRAGEVAASQRGQLYLVGGIVRDLMLNQESLDLDLVVEGDALALAQTLAAEEGGEVTAHLRFGTVKYKKGELAIDFATARSETYPRPGALPQVRPGPMSADLARRDFTINAMALQLSPPKTGELLDPFNGRGDLERGLVRVLHPKSFQDDATRILRMVRYEQRLGFKVEAETERLLRRDLGYLPTVGMDRIRHELEQIWKEVRPELALLRAGELGVLKQIHPSLKADDWLAQAYRKARDLDPRPRQSTYLCLLLYRMEEREGLDFLKKYRFTREEVRTVEELAKVKSLQRELEDERIRPSQVYGLLRGASDEAIKAFAVACGSERASQQALYYLRELSLVKTEMDGNDLRRLGVPPGPQMGQLLKKLLQAKLDGEIGSREEETLFIKRHLKSVRG